MMIQSPKFGIGAVPRAARDALQWRLMVLWAACLLVPTAILALPIWRMLGADLDHSVHAATLARELDLTAIADLAASHGRNSAAISNAAIVALVVTLLLSPLLSGMVASAARSAKTPRLRELVAGALQEYPRMLRMLVWAIVPLGIAGGIGAAAMAAAQSYGEQAILAADAERAGLVAALILVLLLALAHATLDAGRAAFAVDRRRRSAVKAWWDGCKMLVKRPFATFGVYLGITLAGLIVAAVLGIGRINLPPASVGGFIAALLLTQLIVVALAWMRSARLFAMIELARSMRG